MSSNFLSNIDIVNKNNLNKIEMSQDAIKEMLKIKKKINKLQKTNVSNHYNSKELNTFQDKKKLIELENSYKNSLFLLDIMQKKIEKNILKKYDIDTNNQTIQNTLIKKNS
ncbi:hypothetical protein D9V77_02925 [Buchnera aphidicola (Sitobion avenae)]|uniref:Uncharacterized protein n=1 Tax=Buchnera aphidicola (Sitobion avenae) TaxID=571428 RepID=A0A4D6Y989_9GAMM|nr:hypothetical protein [Buchnera aphidicola]QCI25762.1 hypothetical protein D9V77_02925 [Buchnera aphidicola (Sitobion avenae)]